jgi:RNA polymerase-binding transcription factor DksA
MDDADRATLYIERAASAYYARQAKPPAAPQRLIKNCCVCGESIESERRRAMPYAVRCIDCQMDYERGTRR